MRKLDARWDVDVPEAENEEGDRPDSERVHFGLRLGRGRHEAERLASEYANTQTAPAPVSSHDG